MERTLRNKSVLGGVFKGVLWAVCSTVVMVLVFALIYHFVPFSTVTIKIVNQVIKFISIFLGTLVCLKVDGKSGTVKGAVVGGIYAVLAFLLFSALISNFPIGLALLVDVVFSCIVGAICGMSIVNLKK